VGKKEAGPLDFIDKQLTTFRPVSKFWKISTPTLESGNIWKELNNNTHVIFDYYVRCPLCGQDQLMEFTGIKWEGGAGADPKVIKSDNLAWYECKHCNGKWDDDLRNRAVRAGDWLAREKNISIKTYMKMFRPANIGFHISAWISFFVSLSECAAAFIEGQNDLLKLQDFQNSYCGLPWKSRVENKSEANVLKHRIDLSAGVVPEDAVALTCGIDVQKSGFWFVVRAWTRDLSSHLVQYGYLSSWEDVERLVFKTRYPIQGKSEDQTMGIWRASMDTGGGKTADNEWSRTEEIYHWIRKNGRGVVHGIKGADKPQIKRVNPRVIDKMARGNRPIPGGLTLYFLDVNQFKDLFHWRLDREEGETQYMTLNSDTGVDYAQQILAEEKQKDRSGKSKWVPIRRDNHLLDCENYAAACADPEWAPSLTFIASRLPKTQIGQNENKQPQADQRPGAGMRDGRPSWFGNR
jgi:phage terminase large subunit GpA-like protein